MTDREPREFLVCGYDIFPVVRTEEKDGIAVTTELYHTRVHAITKSLKHVTMLFGPPTGLNEAYDIYEASTASRPPGEIVKEQIIPSTPKPFYMWGIEGMGAVPGQTLRGFVSGHGVVYHPREKRRGRRLPPQLVPFLTVMVKQDDGTHRQAQVRIYGCKDLGRDNQLVENIQEEWKFLRLVFDTGKDVNFTAVDGLWILADPLPEEDRTPASPEAIQDLAQHFGAGA